MLTISKLTDLKARLEKRHPAYIQQRPQHNLVYHRKTFGEKRYHLLRLFHCRLNLQHQVFNYKA